MMTEPLVKSYGKKVQAIKQAQQEGTIGDHFSAEMLLELIMALVQAQPSFTAKLDNPTEPKQRKQAIKTAVYALIAKPFVQ